MSQITAQTSVLLRPAPIFPLSHEGLTNIRQISVGKPDTATRIRAARELAKSQSGAALERSAARFAEVMEIENALTAARVENILREKSMIVTTEGVSLNRVSEERTAVGHFADGSGHLLVGAIGTDLLHASVRKGDR